MEGGSCPEDVFIITSCELPENKGKGGVTNFIHITPSILHPPPLFQLFELTVSEVIDDDSSPISPTFSAFLLFD